jgi:hypothetical protein
MANMEQNQKPEVPVAAVKSNPKSKRFLKIAGVLVLAVLVGGNVSQYVSRQSVAARLDETTKAKAEQEVISTVLSKKNDVLTKTVAGLQKQATDALKSTTTQADHGHSSSTNDTEYAEPIDGKLAVSKVELVDFAVLSASFPSKFTGKAYAVTVEFTNLTGASQAYSVFDFSAVTKNGEILAAKNLVAYPDTFGSTVWNNSSLTSGSSKEVTLYFDPGVPLTSLQWKVKANTSPIVSILPIAG